MFGVEIMESTQNEEKERHRKDRAKKAIALAMQNRWSDAVSANMAILGEFPDDLEAHNRLGKALTELGQIEEAKGAFQRALQISPTNAIASKNLDRLTQLGDETPRSQLGEGRAPHAFIEESGKAGVTGLVSLPPAKVFLQMAPGRPVQLEVDGSGLRVTDPDGEYVGRVEPRLASRLVRLIKGGNRYEATVTSVSPEGLMVIIREVHKDPSQAGVSSFPSRGGGDYRVYLPGTVLGREPGEEESEETETVSIKDWSDDDTEPGDDDAYSPVVHRIISTGQESGGGEEEY